MQILFLIFVFFLLFSNINTKNHYFFSEMAFSFHQYTLQLLKSLPKRLISLFGLGDGGGIMLYKPS